MKYDIYLVGVGGQGILTVGEILAGAALARGLPVNFFPSRGMAQRGGFVKAQLRLGREQVGPNIPERTADLIVAMEQSEALKAIRYIRPGGEFLLVDDIWAPADVALGKAAYPRLDAVRAAITAAGAALIDIAPETLPSFEGQTVQPNVFVLGVAMRHTRLGEVFTPAEIEQVIQERWQKAARINRFAFQAGLDYQPAPVGEAG